MEEDGWAILQIVVRLFICTETLSCYLIKLFKISILEKELKHINHTKSMNI